MSDLADLQPAGKFPTGIEGLEHILMGGLPEGRTTLLTGSSGAGKTVFAAELVYRSAAEFDRPALYVTLEESRDDIIRNVLRLGWDLPAMIEAGKLDIIDASRDPDVVE